GRTIALIGKHEAPAKALERVLPIYRAVCRRSAYLALLNENPAALERLLSLVAQSAWLARQIAEQPMLLDELLDPRVFDTPPPLDNERFFTRLVQRLIHSLSIQTTSGRLYDVDTRLRPSGRAGLLVTGIDAFYRYQTHDAWVWEHQALLRSRALAGSRRVCAEFERLRRAVLVAHVDRAKLKVDGARMRRRMRAELSLAKAGGFDPKQDRGGIA